MTTQHTEEKKKINWLYWITGILAVLLIVQSGAVVYYLFRNNKPTQADLPVYREESQRPYRATSYPRTASRTSVRSPSSFWQSSILDDPFTALRQMEDRMNRLFASSALSGGFMGDFVPTMDMEETADSYVIRSDLPGLEKDKISVSVEGNLLTIQGVREERTETEDESRGYYAQERSYGSFARSINLPGPVDQTGISAKYNDGVLTVTLPKAQGAEEKSKIAVQ